MNSFVYFVATAAILFTCTCFIGIVITKELREIEDRAIRRHVLMEDWLFQSLYSIDNKVLLPDEAEKPLSSKPATVYSPEDDPMNEFKRGDF